MFGTKSEINFEHVEKASRQQAGTHEEHTSKRNFGNDQRIARERPAVTLRRASVCVLQVVLQGISLQMHRGRDANDHSRSHSDPCGEQQDAHIDVNLFK
jgi:hypothetical protein